MRILKIHFCETGVYERLLYGIADAIVLPSVKNIWAEANVRIRSFYPRQTMCGFKVITEFYRERNSERYMSRRYIKTGEPEVLKYPEIKPL